MRVGEKLHVLSKTVVCGQEKRLTIMLHAMQPTVALVICTCSRASKLAPCLDSVFAMEKSAGFELIVVDNNSTDNTGEVIAEFSGHASFRFRHVRETRKGLGYARNCGWRLAGTDIVAFTDDDCYVSQDFAETVARIFASEPSLGFLGGRILLFDKTDLPLTIKESTVTERLPAGTFIPAGIIQGANFAFRKSALEQSGGFDTLLGAGTAFPAEDIELVGRLSALGWDGMYTPEPVVHHHHARKTHKEAIALRRGYDVGRGAYYMAYALKNKGVRTQPLLFWMRNMRRNSIQRTAREVRGAIGYLRRRLSPVGAG